MWWRGFEKSFWTISIVRLCKLHYTLSCAFHHFCDPSTSTLIVCVFHCSHCSIFILQKYISLRLITGCVYILLIIDFPTFFLLISYLLIQFMHHHYCHQRMLMIEKSGFLSNKSSKTYRTSQYRITWIVSYVTDFAIAHKLYGWFLSTNYSSVIYSTGIFPK